MCVICGYITKRSLRIVWLSRHLLTRCYLHNKFGNSETTKQKVVIDRLCRLWRVGERSVYRGVRNK